jgi:hypothetical protein
VVSANLQLAERQDAVTIYVIKKKQEKNRDFFEAYKSLQTLVLKEASLVAVTNNGPMLNVLVSGPEQVRQSMDIVKEWQRKANVDCAVFKGKSTITQMIELPVRAAYNAMLAMLGLDSRSAREAGLSTCWLDHEKKWSITHEGSAVIRGRCNLDYLESEVHINMEKFEESGAKQLTTSMKNFAASDRFGPLFELSFSKVEKFNSTDQYGRQPRAGGKGKGKGNF